MSKRLEVGMHGFGYIGRIHMLALETAKLAPGLNPNILWKRCFVRSLEGEAYRLASLVFEEVVVDDGGQLNLNGLDVIDIASPNDLHERVAVQAAAEGVSIYCEKPLANSLESSRRMLDVVERFGVVNQVALCARSLPSVQEAYALLRSGALGRVLNFRAAKLHGSYLNPERPMAWRLQGQRSGAGALMDLGVHAIDLVRFLLGPIVSVESQLRTYVSDRPTATGERQAVDVDDWALLQLTLEGGAVGTLEVSRIHFGQEGTSLLIACEHGTISLNLDKPDSIAVSLLPGRERPEVTEALRAYRLSEKYSTDAFLITHATNFLTFLERVRGMEINYPLPTFRDAFASEQIVDEALGHA